MLKPTLLKCNIASLITYVTNWIPDSIQTVELCFIVFYDAFLFEVLSCLTFISIIYCVGVYRGVYFNVIKGWGGSFRDLWERTNNTT